MRIRPGAIVLLSLSLPLALAPGTAMADWQLQQAIDFASAQALDAQSWTVETGMLRNQERQAYAAANVRVVDGVLRIEGRRERVPNPGYRPGGHGWRQSTAFAEYTSGSIVSKAAYLYGRFEIVARSPGGDGAWPAIWLLHESAGQYGEIDIHESVGKLPDTAFAGVHYGREPDTRQHRNANRRVPGFEGSWHTHVVEWTPERITLSLDGEPLMVFDPRDAMRAGGDPLRQPMRLHINLALGGTWGGPIDDSRLPARFDIASVRIWRWEPGSGGAVPTPAPVPRDDAPAPVPRWGR